MPSKGSCLKAGVILRYTVLQALGLIVFVAALLFVRAWIVFFPPWLFWLLVVLWIAKDAALYPLVWRSYDTHGGMVTGPAAGTSGVARDRLAPDGYIETGGELWKARLEAGAEPVEKGQGVRVTGREGLTLFVVPRDTEATGREG